MANETKEFGKLIKLTIESLDEMNKGIFTAMFNPDSYTRKYVVNYSKRNILDSGKEEFDYTKTMPENFTLKLILDGTGVSDFAASYLPVFDKEFSTVQQKVDDFLILAGAKNQKKEGGTELAIYWGDDLKITSCRLKEVTVNYTLFNRQGNVLRAELNAVFMVGGSDTIIQADEDEPVDSALDEAADAGSADGIVIKIT